MVSRSSKMWKWAKQIFCTCPDTTLIRNIHGDEINSLDARSLWKCNACEAIHKSDLPYNIQSAKTESVGFFNDAVANFEEEQAAAVADKIPDGFSIEHHVALGHYYPKWGRNYLHREDSGKYSPLDPMFMHYGTILCKTEEQARLIVKECHAQQTIRVIT